MSQTINNRYRLLDQLGQGGMGTVYRALDRLTGRTVALKRVAVSPGDLQFGSKGSTDDSNSIRLALATEFRTLAGLRHPHIVSVLDYGFDHIGNNEPYYTMQLIEGAKPLTSYAVGLDTVARVRLLGQTLLALAYLHRRSIIHRDLKPDNVLVTSEGVVQVMDFGLAFHQMQSVTNLYQGAVGTLAYMAPELFTEEAATVQSDLYAIGVMVYELFAKRHPFNIRNMALLLNNVMNVTPDTSMFDTQLANVVNRLLAKKPDERYDSADEVLQALCEATEQPLPSEDAALRESFLQAAQFVGRQAELEQLKAALDTNTHGSSAWLVAGESGVGKSRLLEELRIRALVDGMLVLRGQAVEGGGLPYQL